MANLIGEQTIKLVGERVMGLMREYHSAINRVYDEDGKIKISMGVEIKFEQQKNKVRGGIKFVTDQIDDESVGWADELQGDLFKDRYQEKPPRRENELEGATPVPELSRKLLPSPEGAHDCADVCPQASVTEAVDGELAPDETKPPEDETKGTSDETGSALLTFRVTDRVTGETWEGQDVDAEAARAAAWVASTNDESFLFAEHCDIEVQNASGKWVKLKDVTSVTAPPTEELSLDCQSCQDHRRKGNKHHGVTIPGQSGKCIREGGPCESGMKAQTKCLREEGEAA
jgi:hypothetical protein